jgi:hypothetical protein
MQTAQIARANFTRYLSNATHSHSTMHDAHDAHTFDPVRFDSRAYEQCDMRAHSIDRFSLQIDTLI